MSEHFLGIDLGSSYTKFTVVNQENKRIHTSVIPTLSRHHDEYDNTVKGLHDQFNIKRICTTGYGRNSVNGDLQKTELICASAGVSAGHPIHKSILDIGGEDIKIIESGRKGEVLNFYMNDKCAAGTGAFITEIAEKAELGIEEMSTLAEKSTTGKVINSFCTVFAKSEILSWKFEGVSIEDIARGIYLSIINRICKMPFRTDLPIYVCGGVIAYHPYLRDLMESELQTQVHVSPEPLFAGAMGAAILARDYRQD